MITDATTTCEHELAAVAAAEAVADAADNICTESLRDRLNVSFFSLSESEYDSNEPGPLAAQQPTVFVHIGSMDARRAAEVVQIAAAAAIYSRMLSATPAAKIAFWKTLLASSVGPHKLSYVARWLVHDTHGEFPRIVLDHRSLPHLSTNMSYLYDYAYHSAIVAAQKRGVALDTMIATHLDALLPALTIEDTGSASSMRVTRSQTTQAATCLRAARAFARTKTAGEAETPSFAIGLLLPSRTQPVKRVVAILDRLAAEFATRRFSIHLVSCDALWKDDVVDMDAMTALVRRSHLVDHLETIGVGRIGPYVSTDALRRFALETFTPSDIPAPARSRHRRRALSLVGSLSSARHVAAVCSALRYGCPYDALNFASLFERVPAAEYAQCWEWLAFGVFCSRSRVRANAAMRCRLDLSHNELLSEDVDAFVAALEAPARTLLRRVNTAGDENHDSGEVVPLPISDGVSDRVGVCVLRGAAAIYSKHHADAVLYSADDNTDTLLEVLGATTDDRWYCVVVPGVGLGWIRQADAMSVDWEPATATVPVIETDQARASPRPELALVLNFRDSRGEVCELQRMFEAVGAQLVSLEIHEVLNERAAVLEAICTHCPRLKHLGVSSWDLVESDMSALVHALERGGRYNRQLESLNLSYNELRGDAFDGLVAALSDPASIPQIRELRLFYSILRNADIDKLYDVLSVNKTLQCLELELYPLRDRTPEYMAPRNRLDEAFQNERLCPALLASASKVAFLSVVRATKSAALDSFVVSLVFQFAATDVRRSLLWIELSDSIRYTDEENYDDRHDDGYDWIFGPPRW